jgi:myo-inositol-1(or 4)-monophosphatase
VECEIYREAAERAALRGGEILRNAFGKVAAREKAPYDLVTDADVASQRAVAEFLLDAFPDHTVLAEEEGLTPDPGRAFRWVIDPLDGTVNFAHGLPLWCVSIGLEYLGDLVAGVIHAPLLGQTFAASKGRGATLNGRPMGVSATDRLGASLIATGMPTAFRADAERQMAWFRRLSTDTHSVRRTGTSAWNLAMVAAGGFEVFYASSMHPWDAAAGVVLVREAGGVVTGLDGGPYDLYGEGILATNGAVHAEAVDALAGAWPASRGGA